MAATKRGSHLMLSLERLATETQRPFQRIGLSATQRPLEEIARFLGGFEAPGRPRDVAVVDAGVRKQLDLEVIVPIDDMSLVGRPQRGPRRRRPILDLALHPPRAARPDPRAPLHDRVRQQPPQRRAPGREPQRAGRARRSRAPTTARSHASSASRSRSALKARMAARDRRHLVAGARDRHGRGRPGRAGRGAAIGRERSATDRPRRPSGGRAQRGQADPEVPRRPPADGGRRRAHAGGRHRGHALPAQPARRPRPADRGDDRRRDLVGRGPRGDGASRGSASPISPTTCSAACSTCSPVATRPMRSPSCGRASCGTAPADTVRAREGAGRLAITSGGTIPDRGLFGVFTTDGSRVGELDEECVYESRRGEVFLLGASSWRIEDITRDQVVVTPAPGEHGKLPFWKAPGPGRPVELGLAIGRFTRELRSKHAEEALTTLREDLGLDERAAANLVNYVDEQSAVSAVPDDRTIVVERFRDELGDWRVCILSPIGARVLTPWALAIEARLQERLGPGAQVLWSDDGIVIRLPEAVDSIPLDDLLFTPEEIEEAVVATLPGTALFASIFREASARALLLPRRMPGRRTALWQQRQRSADLLSAAGRYPEFPMLLEATRECLRDHFDVPALQELMASLASRRTRMIAVDTERASPFAQSLLFAWIAVFMYEGDAPLAERRAAALSLDRDLLRDLLGSEDLRELLDPAALDAVELELQRLADGRQARSLDGVHDLLRDLGPLSDAEIAARADPPASDGVHTLVAEHRAFRVTIAGVERVAAVGGCGAAARGAGRHAPRRPPERVRRGAGAPDRGSGRSVRPHARSVRHGRHRSSLGDRSRPRPPGLGGARRGRPRRARRVPARRLRARMVRRERAASDPPSLAGGAAPGGGAGRCRGVRAVPARVAGRRSATRGTRRADPGPAAPAGCRHPRLDPRARRAARSGAGVPPGRPRRPHGERRARLDRSGGARDRRRARHAAVP